MIDHGQISSEHTSLTYPELSILSLNAAIELDNRIRTNDTSRSEAIVKFIENLGLQAVKDSGPEALLHISDPTTVDLYYRVLSHLTCGNIDTIDSLAQHVQTYVSMAENSLDEASIDALERFRDFCLALHRELLSEIYERYRDSMPDA